MVYWVVSVEVVGTVVAVAGWVDKTLRTLDFGAWNLEFGFGVTRVLAIEKNLHGHAGRARQSEGTETEKVVQMDSHDLEVAGLASPLSKLARYLSPHASALLLPPSLSPSASLTALRYTAPRLISRVYVNPRHRLNVDQLGRLSAGLLHREALVLTIRGTAAGLRSHYERCYLMPKC